ncbi:MAG: hypothetical protein OHK0013_09790 [Sandaracinaceae bacterium]
MRRALLLLATLVGALPCTQGCGSAEGTVDPAPVEPTPPRAEGSPSSAAPAPEASPPPGSHESAGRDAAGACVRVEACCAAYVTAIGDDTEAERARRACAELDRLEALGDAADEACLAAIEGWRQSLELREREVPTACR